MRRLNFLMQGPTECCAALCALLLGLGALVGCQHRGGLFGVDRCAAIPPGAVPPPAGNFTCQWQHAQMAAGDADHFVIYENEWYQGGNSLGPAGQRHLDELALHMAESPEPVVIEPHFDAEQNQVDVTKNEQRKQYVIQALAAKGVPEPQHRVVLAYPDTEGLYGGEAARLGNSRMNGTPGTGGGINSGGNYGGASVGGGSFFSGSINGGGMGVY